ncbi:MAG: S41 family peptidase [Acidimicrobiia bacterium]|nr:S41 family peptidase [Acidimicrobiia bacterium]
MRPNTRATASPRILLAAVLAVAVMASGCAQGASDADAFEGIWQSEGFGLILDVSGGIDVYEYTPVSCGLVAGGSERGSGEILGIAGDRLILAEADRTISFDRIEALPLACSERYYTEDPTASFEVLVATMEEHYAFFDLRQPDWPERAEAAASAVTVDLDDAGLLRAMQDLLGPLGDAQVRISGPGRDLLPEGAWSAGAASPEVVALAERIRSGRVPGLDEVEITGDRAVVSGLLSGPSGDIGYLAINRLAGFDADPTAEERTLADALFEQLGRFGGAGALIIDLRVNRGGRESLAMLTASRFVSEDTPVATRLVRAGGTSSYVDGGDVVVRPLPSGPYPARIAVLVGPGTSGAGELLALALREVPGAVLVGAPTSGSLSPLLVRTLPNGWTLGLSNQQVIDSDGVLWEGAGIPPDVEVTEPATDDRDPVIEAALAALG